MIATSKNNRDYMWFQILMFYLCVLSAYTGAIKKWVTPKLPWFVPFLYFWCIGTALYVVHRLGHKQKFWEPWYRSHTLGHHLQAYPAHRFIQEKYHKNTVDRYYINPLIYVVAGFLTSWIFCHVLFTVSRLEELMLMFIAAAGSILEDQAHSQMHSYENWPWLSRYPCIREYWLYLRTLHFVHHTAPGNQTNFATVAVFFDKAYGSYWYADVHRDVFDAYLARRYRK